jgi:hypothetical protein
MTQKHRAAIDAMNAAEERANWHVDPSDDFDQPRVLNHAGNVVAVLPDGSEDEAHLIAAAPKMLAALKFAQKHGFHDMVDAAIAKAEGRSNSTGGSE